jgi:hypothetical protein
MYEDTLFELSTKLYTKETATVYIDLPARGISGDPPFHGDPGSMDLD